jgi:hypothetical protein
LLLVSSPVDPEFELLVVAMGINLLEDLLKNRFKSPGIEEDEILKEKSENHRIKFAIQHRIGLKNILLKNLHILRVLATILARVHLEAKEKGLTREAYKKIYMERVESLEKDHSPETVFKTRLTMRKYLRELMTNQKRAIDILMKEAAEAY